MLFVLRRWRVGEELVKGRSVAKECCWGYVRKCKIWIMKR